MTLSKKNIDKLKSVSESISNNKNITYSKNHKNHANPADLFYSIIDNTKDINDTTMVNQKLKISENIISKTSPDKFNSSNNWNVKRTNNQLSEEELLYDEFNYLLDE